MRSSFPARSSKARATAVMASTPPRRSYREPSTAPTSCALVTNGATPFPHHTSSNLCHRRQVNLYPLLTDRTGVRGGAGGMGAANGPSRLRTTTSARRKYAADANPDDPWDCRGHVRHKPVSPERGLRTATGRLHPAAGPAVGSGACSEGNADQVPGDEEQCPDDRHRDEERHHQRDHRADPRPFVIATGEHHDQGEVRHDRVDDVPGGVADAKGGEHRGRADAQAQEQWDED